MRASGFDPDAASAMSALPSLPGPQSPGASDTRPLRTDARRLVIGFSAFLLISLWGALVYTISTERNLTLRTTIKENANLARAFEEHIVRTIRAVDQVTLFVKDRYERHGSRLNLARYTAGGRIAAEIYNQIGIIDERGMYIMSNLPNFKPMNLADREHFQVHVARDSGELFVGKPVLGRASGKWSIQFTRRINKPDGSFGGVVVISVDPFYFSSFYRQVDLGSNGLVTLVGSDGIVRARQSGSDIAVSQNLQQSEPFTKLASSPVGSYVAACPVDGIKRIMAYRALSAYPLIVLVGSAESDAFADFDARRVRYLGAGLLMSIAVLAFAIALVTMIDRRRRAHEALRIAMAQTESANRVKSEFLANMAHELRTPLNGILGVAELLKTELAEPAQHKFVELIYANGRRLLELVNSILDLAKIEAGRMEVELSEVDLRALLDEVVRTHAAAAASKGIACGSRIAEALPATFTCDRTKVVQILNALLHNAVDLTERGEVELAVGREGSDLRFEVRDTGPGVAAEAQARLFEPFALDERLATRTHAGTRLELALAKALVQLMGGSIGVSSAPGRGALFHFTLPLGDELRGRTA
jgi:signal transduction histidine kinase